MVHSVHPTAPVDTMVCKDIANGMGISSNIERVQNY